MRASIFSRLRPSLRSLATSAAHPHRLMQLTPPSHFGRPLAPLSCCALHSNSTRVQPRACGLLGGILLRSPKRRPSLARRLLSSRSPRDPYTVLDVPRGANQARPQSELTLTLTLNLTLTLALALAPAPILTLTLIQTRWDQMWRATSNYGRKGLPLQAA